MYIKKINKFEEEMGLGDLAWTGGIYRNKVGWRWSQCKGDLTRTKL
ncbi:rCG43202 [Rattus norvegicus]|uniref:RCG43202 n=1 Tax=Rattus norvegicus TaxID=10116 RepID=A6IW57_RAT|nr:rCG43202 [Rattus norvegicus]